MKIAILGAGFTGLTAALRLQQAGHQVTIFESEPEVGGLAGGFKHPSWGWTLEKSYHHWFLSDKFAHSLAQELYQPVLNITPETNIYIKGQILPIDSPLSLLRFPYLSTLDKLRTCLTLAYLKLSSGEKHFEGKLALPWIKKWMGVGSTEIIWDPLFEGKFGDLKNEVTLPWFCGRIKKRSKTLCY
ncbi:MAG: FAD-dependent oxidoreductase, partial [Dehalococcoidia bacterium]|nr:FAD-dependent oxidoreductase [Dehalococcoidia bacterium]